MKHFIGLLLFILLPQLSFTQKIKSFPFNNPDLKIEDRVEDLISRLTLEEKINQLIFNTPAIENLGIPAYNWWNECLHGVARNGRATVFPQAIGLAATWDPELVREIADVIATEARAKYNIASKNNYRGIYQGLTFWSPNVNIFRDPRWGRGQETYGEDPYLSSRIGVAFVKGLQGNHPKYLKAAGMAKHFAVHNGPEELRHEFDAQVSMKDLWETYLPAFKALVTEANVEGVMGAYNRVNGEPCCAHPYLMNKVLRGMWNFKGYFVSDCWALVDFYNGHKIVKDAPQAAALALNEGCNLNCGDTYSKLSEALKQGFITEEKINDNLRQLLPTRFKLGLFDPPGANPYDFIGPENIGSTDHLNLSRKAAASSMVLLKNQNDLLPLFTDVSSLFITGPLATDAQVLLGNYYGVSSELVSYLEGVVAAVSPQTSVRYSQGALLDEKNRNPIDWYSGNAAETEVTIAFLGISQLIEGEEGESIASKYYGDRVDIGLPPNQIEFLKRIRSKAKKLVVVLSAGSALACREVLDLADAVIYSWYPGEQGGHGLADILFGKTDPNGKLPVTFVSSIEDLPPYDDYSMENRTYKYANSGILFPFGYGLSYTDFEFSNLKLMNESKDSKTTKYRIHFEIENVGKRRGEETYQIYLSDLDANFQVPKHSLIHFEKVSLWPGENRVIEYVLNEEDLKVVNMEGERVLDPGKFKLYIGPSSPAKESPYVQKFSFLETTFKLN